MYILDLNNYLNSISKFNYAISKIDVPYNPKNFPIEYAIGKDLDIFVSSDDFEKLRDSTNKYFMKYKNFEFKIIEKDNNFKLRMGKNNKLHYLIDITINNKLIKNKIKKDNYYILSLENEIKVREAAVKKNLNKAYHIDWLVRNS
jgi:hypothetical protein